jgi:hypothetical protein
MNKQRGIKLRKHCYLLQWDDGLVLDAWGGYGPLLCETKAAAVELAREVENHYDDYEGSITIRRLPMNLED